MSTILIIGLGLIGGSFALACKELYPNLIIKGIDTDKDNLEKALQLGIITEKGTKEDSRTADWVVLATPVDVIPHLSQELLTIIGENTLLIDFGSTKYSIAQIVDTHKHRGNFIATHPIAGTEFSGASAAFPSLFKDKTIILCDIEKTNPSLLIKAEKVFKQLKMHIVYMDAKTHDLHIAYVSHLSHVSSFMLGKTVIEKEKDQQCIFDLAGSGFASTVRLAKSSPKTWTAIFKENKDNLLEALENYIISLQKFKYSIEKDNFDEIYQQLEKTNKIREILKDIR